MTRASATVTPLVRRIDELDWNRTVVGLDEVGAAATGPILTSDECGRLRRVGREIEVRDTRRRLIDCFSDLVEIDRQ